MSNPVQVKFDDFSITIGPTNNARPLSTRDAEYILGLAEDLISQYFHNHFRSHDGMTLLDGSNDPDVGGEGLEFKFAILGLVSIPVDPAEGRSETTSLDFSGGIAYFEGSPNAEGPSAAEVQALVSLALNEADLLEALRTEYPYITEASYTRGSSSSNNPKKEDSEAGQETDEELVSSQLMGGPLDTPLGNDNQDQLLVIVVSAGGAAFVFSILVAAGFLVKQKQQRSAFWREDNHRQSNTSKEEVIEVDAALDDVPLECGSPNKRRSNREAKQQSLHLRDSLRDTNAQDDALSDSGSSRLGRLLTSAAAVASALPPLCTKPSQSEDDEFEKASGGDSNVNGKGDPDTSSCSNDSTHSNDSNKDFDTCPSDFEGNAFVKPNLIPVTDLERFNDDDPRNPLPQSQIDAVSGLNDTLPSTDIDETPSPSPSKSRAKQILAKYVQPITGTILPFSSSAGLSYFTGHQGNYDDDDDDDGNAADCETPDKSKKQSLTPRTATTAGDHWSDVSSDYRTDDFEMDRAWDPDDTSIGSELGQDIFSPKSNYNDEVSLLDSLSGHADRYNLGKLRTPPPKRRPQMDRRVQNVMDTAEV